VFACSNATSRSTQQIDAVHQRFLQLLDRSSIDLDQEFSLLKVINMRTSARNQFVGTVTSIRAGAVNDEVELTLPGGAKLVAIVTRESTQSLGLRTSMTAMALVKSSSVLIATGLEDAKVSARNQLIGTVAQVTPGAVNAEVVLDIAGGGSVAAIVTQGSVQSMGLAPGAEATALFKASSVILAVTN
jgi:molybdate transport system regulatory protein